MFEGRPESTQSNVALSGDYQKLRRAVVKAGSDRDRAVRNICKLYGCKELARLPFGTRAAATSLLHERYGRG